MYWLILPFEYQRHWMLYMIGLNLSTGLCVITDFNKTSGSGSNKQFIFGFPSIQSGQRSSLQPDTELEKILYSKLIPDIEKCGLVMTDIIYPNYQMPQQSNQNDCGVVLIYSIYSFLDSKLFHHYLVTPARTYELSPDMKRYVKCLCVDTTQRVGSEKKKCPLHQCVAYRALFEYLLFYAYKLVYDHMTSSYS